MGCDLSLTSEKMFCFNLFCFALLFCFAFYFFCFVVFLAFKKILVVFWFGFVSWLHFSLTDIKVLAAVYALAEYTANLSSIESR